MSDPLPAISFKKRSAAKKNIRRKIPAQEESAAPVARPSSPTHSDSDSDSDSDDDGGVGHSTRPVKRSRMTGPVTASSSKQLDKNNPEDMMRAAAVPGASASASASTSRPLPRPDEATKTVEWFDDYNKDGGTGSRAGAGAGHGRDDDLSAQNLLGKTRKLQQQPQSQQQQQQQQRTTAPEKDTKKKKFGPIKAPSNVRTITITDFAPDVCKDYKLTGFCGFGDSCKFLHAREDYKQGWELDREWEINTTSGGRKPAATTVADRSASARNDAAGNSSDDEDEEGMEDIPFACIICKRPYTDPVVTKCGHYFCEACALKRYRKSPNCAACGSGTGGVFNVAKKLESMLKRKRERMERRREKAREMGEEVSSDEEEEEED